MAEQTAKPAAKSKTIQFLAAGGLTMIAAVVQEAIKAQPDWGVLSTMIAGIILSIGGGAYGRTVAQGPLTGAADPPK